jgi:chromosome segregation protein
MEAAQQGFIHKKREIRHLTREVAALLDVVRDLSADRVSLQEQAAVIEEELQNLRQKQHQSELEIAHTEKDLLRSMEGCQRLEERLALKRLEDAQFREENEILKQEMADADAKKSDGEERKSALENEIGAFTEALSFKRRELGETRERVTVAKVKTASLKEKCESGLRAGKRFENLLLDLKERIATHETEQELGKNESAGIVKAIGQSEEAQKSLMIRLVEAEAAFAGLRERFESEGSAVQEEEGTLRSLRTSCEESRKQSTEQSLKLSELAMQLRHLEESLMERFRVNMASIVPAYGAVSCNEMEKRQRQAELNRFIDEMGEVNLMAIDEYRQLEDRYNFLCAQRDDLEESMKALQQAIQRINRTTRKRFLETFQLVNVKFKEIFPRLFCGGSAELRLTDENDLLETGIEIVVQPPGKKLQNVTLLSGGEKALTAVALIFAIFLIKPSPFCLLDEVDAPLDDANIGRFNEIVREMSAASQFIVITHNKTTMAVADTLFGVTMEEPGVSKLVSVRLN